MKENSPPRVCVIAVCALLFVALLVINGLAGAGRGESVTGTTRTRAGLSECLECVEHGTVVTETAD